METLMKKLRSGNAEDNATFLYSIRVLGTLVDITHSLVELRSGNAMGYVTLFHRIHVLGTLI